MRVIEVTHEVKDFDEWKVGFNAHEDTRIKFGLIDVEILTSIENRNLVTVVMEEAVPGGFERFSKAADLPTLMKKYGVISEPEIKFFEKELAA